MSSEFLIEYKKEKRKLVIDDLVSDYRMTTLDYDERFIFFSLREESKEDKFFKNIPITSRDYGCYQGAFPGLVLNPHKQYIEVGAGLGGFVEELVRKRRNKKNISEDNRPTIIDPADYSRLDALLLEAMRYVDDEKPGLKQETINLIKEVKQRCETYLDKEQVRIINMKVEDALVYHPELLGCADYIVDFLGPLTHAQAYKHFKNIEDEEAKQRAASLKETFLMMLKPGGMIYSYK